MNEIIFENDFEKMRQLIPAGTHTVVLYDRNVAQWMSLAADPSWETIPLDGGEGLKQWEHVQQVVTRLMELRVDRSWFLAGMGGGTVCDFAGFIASVYMRGIPFGLIPTTLLAQVDAALGGKNGIHFGPYKNIIGCTVLPRWVFCNPAVLSTLPPEEFRCGLAECIKHGAIASQDYFRFIENEVAPCTRFSELSPQVLERLITGSQEIKMKIVGEDLHEKGIRKALNFGHTFGHALAAYVPDLTHGQAVAKGMVLAARHAVEQGLLAPDRAARLSEVLASCGLDTSLPCAGNTYIPYMVHDKKKRGKDLEFVLLEDIGKYVFVQEPVVIWENRSRNPGVTLGAGLDRDLALWADKAPWVECRLDLAPELSAVGMVALRMQCMGRENRLMLTCPVTPGQTSVPDMLREMISWGAGWVDIPLDASPEYAGALSEMARENGVGIIRSVHFWDSGEGRIPDAGELEAITQKTFGEGADFLKIAVLTRSREDSEALLSWCERQNEREDIRFRITLMIMGGDALWARKRALRKGYPFVYSAPDHNRITAPGQPSYQELYP